MTRLVSSAAVAAFAVLAASCAPTADTAGAEGNAATGPERQCFNSDQVRNFRAGGSNQLYIRSQRDQVFELNTSGGCLDLNFANALVITGDRPLGGNRICTGDWAQIRVLGTSQPSSCRARVERVLTAEQVAALPSAQRP